MHDPAAPLSDAERQISAQILGAITAHWEKLGNTDAERLQEAFLRRVGALLCKEQQWTLTVEPVPIDILMTSLPWTIETIRLSWMQGMLKVIWR